MYMYSKIALVESVRVQASFLLVFLRYMHSPVPPDPLYSLMSPIARPMTR